MISTMKWVRNLLLKGSSPQSDLANAEWKALESTLATKCTLPKDNQSIKHIRPKKHVDREKYDKYYECEYSSMVTTYLPPC